MSIPAIVFLDFTQLVLVTEFTLKITEFSADKWKMCS